MIVYRSEEDGTLSPEAWVDVDITTGQAEGYTRYELDDVITLEPEQCFGSYGDIGEILAKAGFLRKA